MFVWSLTLSGRQEINPYFQHRLLPLIRLICLHMVIIHSMWQLQPSYAICIVCGNYPLCGDYCLCVAITASVWRLLPLCGDYCLCVAITASVWRLLPLCGDYCLCVTSSQPVDWHIQVVLEDSQKWLNATCIIQDWPLPFVLIYAFMCSLFKFMCMYDDVNVCMCMYVCIQMWLYVYVYICIYIYIYICIYLKCI